MSSYCSMFLTEVSNVDGRLFEIFCWLVASMAVVIMAVYSLLLCDELIGDVLFCSASIRRSSMRGDKSPLFMKEAREEALHFGWRQNGEEEDLMVSA